ncbi:YpmS family protein [Ornithinibacillus contaminans]|uniref:YpmS family protein n=1 Tax=Ornithinibacillus contaminans TaxID=694055 RepID=UPI00064DE51F|nr:YpmS family protein [Ornithinibacillus contaminans]
MKQDQTNYIKWKRSFITLLIINIAIVLLLCLLIFWPVKQPEISGGNQVPTQESSEFIIRTTKSNLNELINSYMNEILKDSKHKFHVSLEDDVHLIGELPVFSTTVPVSIHLEPFVQENGDVVLEQKSITLGLLSLPNQKIMEYMEKYLSMPDWITINPADEEIYVAVTDMDIKSNFQVSVERIDLAANNLAFKIEIPYETLGIETIVH